MNAGRDPQPTDLRTDGILRRKDLWKYRDQQAAAFPPDREPSPEAEWKRRRSADSEGDSNRLPSRILLMRRPRGAGRSVKPFPEKAKQDQRSRSDHIFPRLRRHAEFIHRAHCGLLRLTRAAPDWASGDGQAEWAFGLRTI